MKKIIFTIIALLFPLITHAVFSVPNLATSTAQGWTYPARINGLDFAYVSPYFIATSTTASSTFSGGVDVLRICLRGTTTCLGGAVNLSNVNGVLTILNGGTGLTTYNENSLVFYNGVTFDSLADVAVAGGSSFLGVGSTTPGTRLSLGSTGNNTINISDTGTSTFGTGLDLRSGCFSINSVCVGSGAGTVSTGLTGELPWYAANGTTLSASSSASLTVGRIFATSTATSTIAGGFTVSSTAFVVQKATGNVGINILIPTARFHVDNSSSGSFQVGSDSSLAISTGISGGVLGFTASGNLGSGTSTPYARLSVEESSTVVPFVVGDQGTSTPLLWVNSRGFVGIATTSLQALLDIGASTVARPSLYIEPGPAPTATTTGFVWMDSKQNQFVLSNGNNLYQGGGMYRAQTDDVINSATLTSALSSTYTGTTTIFANTLKVGQRFSIWGAGYYTTPIANTDTVTIQTSVASTTGTMVISTVTTGAFPASATNLPFDFNMNCTVRAIGVSGTIVCDGDFKYTTALSGVAKTSNSLSTIGTIKLDTTVNEWLDVKANWSVAAGGQTATIQESWIDF